MQKVGLTLKRGDIVVINEKAPFVPEVRKDLTGKKGVIVSAGEDLYWDYVVVFPDSEREGGQFGMLQREIKKCES